MLDRVLLIGGVGWLLWGRAAGEPFRIEWFVWAQTLSYAVTFLVALAFVLRLSGPVSMAWRPAFSIVVVRQSFPFAVLILLMTFYYRIDTVMLERMLPDGALQAGIYYQGFRWFEALNMLGYLVAGLLLPMFSRMLQERADVTPLAGLAFRLVLVASLAAAVFGSLHAAGVMGLLYADHVAEAARVFALLIWCFAAVCTTYVFGTLLTAGGELRLLNWMAAGGAVLNIALNALLIPRLQAEGAAWAALVTQVLTATAQVVLAARMHRLAGIAPTLFRAALYATGLAGLGLGLDRLALPFWMTGLVFALLAAGAALLTGLLRPAELRAAMALEGTGRQG